ncbi:hypothetical protein EVAR_54761_1 [Eumeta japonica]|uniref:Uncharacterized protein n=1 Tax=Eumeta variegata TaxID=151549 RepID=A0A4C1YFP5_EUMVA|nr:hypothetical protein EVAR_54761_1 [Eumeta japonica]
MSPDSTVKCRNASSGRCEIFQSIMVTDVNVIKVTWTFSRAAGVIDKVYDFTRRRLGPAPRGQCRRRAPRGLVVRDPATSCAPSNGYSVCDVWCEEKL